MQEVSARTIRRRLQQSGLSARRPLLRLPLMQNHRRLRRQWCDERRIWTAECNEIVFTDESRFCLQHHDGRIRVWRHRGERMLKICVMHRHTDPAPGIMVWGGIGYHSRTPLVRIAGTLNSQSYISEVLEPVILPYLQGLPTAIFQQDNARPHVAHIVQRFFLNRQIELLPWQRVEAAWSAVPQEHIQSLFESMPRKHRLTHGFFDPQVKMADVTRGSQRNVSAFVIKTGSTTQWQADLALKEMATSDMRNRRHVQPLLIWSTNAAHPKSLVFLDEEFDIFAAARGPEGEEEGEEEAEPIDVSAPALKKAVVRIGKALEKKYFVDLEKRLDQSQNAPKYCVKTHRRKARINKNNKACIWVTRSIQGFPRWVNRSKHNSYSQKVENKINLYPKKMLQWPPILASSFDKATSHTSPSTRQYLDEKKDETGISYIIFKHIPAESPDLAPMDFCAFGLLRTALRSRKPKTEIGSRVGRNQTTLMRVCDLWMQEGTTDRRVRSNPPQCTTSRADRQIVRMAVTDSSVTLRTVAQHIQSVTHHPVSARTIRRRLQQSVLSARRPLLRLSLMQNHRRLRRHGAMKEGYGRQNVMKLSLLTSHASVCNTTMVGFSLETPWREDAEKLRYAPPQWSCTGYYGMGRQRYISEVLEPVVLPYLQGFPTAIFQQDNAPPHVAHIVQRFFLNRQIELLPWQRVEAAWSAVPQEHIQSLFESMPSEAGRKHRLTHGFFDPQVKMADVSRGSQRYNIYQFGFVPCRSAENALAAINQFIDRDMEEGEKTLVISLDIRRAFDTVQRYSIIEALREVSCPEELLQLITSYLINRKMAYSVWGHTAHILSLRGVPQGAASSPFLFNMIARKAFTLQKPRKSELVGFADDFTLMVQVAPKLPINVK
ncbi:hypothetical protein LAZ67_9000649 [Cordylochernes scorpioides]|uniref:Reverse transcriptase domain-containing protein n=1 Tax=Cordylochernes scorpioides TaxID=51811 RepID=A0ABY6KTB4_9ARAC|nr:hypothetical protein LAZ67_9000649 [Cordylochernes scorpioides]